MEKVLGEFETIRVKFEGREEHVEISGNGEVRVDSINTGQSVNIFKSEDETTGSYSGQASGSIDNGWDTFRKQSEYIQLLVQIQGADHNVHKEFDEAIAKIKELTYA